MILLRNQKDNQDVSDDHNLNVSLLLSLSFSLEFSSSGKVKINQILIIWVFKLPSDLTFI